MVRQGIVASQISTLDSDDVRFWHKADIPTRSTNVRFWG
jgi:hypothetical protein